MNNQLNLYSSYEDLLKDFQKGKITRNELQNHYQNLQNKKQINREESELAIKEAKRPAFARDDSSEKSYVNVIDDMFKSGNLTYSPTLRKSLLDKTITPTQAKDIDAKYKQTLLVNNKPNNDLGIQQTIDDDSEESSLASSISRGIDKNYDEQDTKNPSLGLMPLLKTAGSIALEGATMGVYESDFKPKTKGQVLAYMGISLAASIPTFMAVEAAAAATGTAVLPVIEETAFIGKHVKNAFKAIKGLEDIAKLSTDAKRALKAERILTGISYGKSIASNAALGVGVGAVKGGIKKARGQKVDVLESALAEGFLFGAGAAVLSPIVHGLVKGSEKAFQSDLMPFDSTIRRAFKSKKIVSENAEALYSELAKDGQTPEFFNGIREVGAKGGLKEGTDLHNLYKSLQRYDAVEPYIASPEQLSKMPELAKAAFNNNTSEAAKALFIGTVDSPAPLKSLYDGDDNLQSLMQAGKHSDALDYVANKSHEIVSSTEFKDWASLPYKIGTKEMAEVKTKMFMQSARYQNMEGMKEKVLSYYENPTPENMNSLLSTRGVQTRGDKFVGTKFGTEKDLSTLKSFNSFEGKVVDRISHVEADELASNITTSWIDSIVGAVDGKGDRPFLRQNIGKIRDHEDVLQATISLNRDFHRSGIEAYANKKDFADSFSQLKNKSKGSSYNAAAKIIMGTEENRVNLLKAKSLSDEVSFLENQIADGVNDGGTKNLLEVRKVQRTTLQTKIVKTREAIKAHESQIIELNPGNPKAVQKFLGEMNQIFLPNARAFIGDSTESLLTKRFAEIPLSKEPLKSTPSVEVPNAKPSGVPESPSAEVKPIAEVKPVEEGLVSPEGQLGGTAPEEVVAPVEPTLIDEKINFSKSAVFLKRRSELADAMTLLHVSGADIPEHTYQSTILGSLSIEKFLRRQFGTNNPFNVAITQRMKEAELFIKKDASLYESRISALGIKQDTKLSNDVFHYIESGMDKASSEFTALQPKEQKLVENAANEIKSIYFDRITRMNAKLKKVGLPQITPRKNYITHLKEVDSEMDVLFSNGVESYMNFMESKAKPVIAGINQIKNEKRFQPSKVPFAFGKERTGSKDIQTDAIKAVRAYIIPSLRKEHYSELMREIDFAAPFAPTNMGNLMYKINKKVILGIDDESRTALLPGKESSKAIEGLMKWSAKVNILGNLNVLVANALSVGSSLSAGFPNFIKSFTIFKTEEGKFLEQASTIINTRKSIDLEASDFFGGKNLLHKGFLSIEGVLAKASHSFDAIAAKNAVGSFYSLGRSQGLTRNQAVKFADDYASRLQGGVTSAEKPVIMMESILTRALSQFRSYVLNLMTTIASDLPQIARNEGSIKSVNQMIKFFGGASIANEYAKTLGMKDVFALEAGLMPGYVGEASNNPFFPMLDPVIKAAKTVAGLPESDTKIQDVADTALEFLPAGRGLGRINKAFQDKSTTSENLPSRAAFGLKQAKAREKEIKDEALYEKGYGKDTSTGYEHLLRGTKKAFHVKHVGRGIRNFLLK